MGWIKANPDDDLHAKVKAYRDHDDTNVANMTEAANALLMRGAISFEADKGEVLADE
jgi:hypothetical protein